jgi:xylan 1,4-beta-xylosidase
MRYYNPIIPGFYPDPSVCRVGADYYLVNSSFEFFPGVPLFHSKNLVKWEQIGHVLTRTSQVPMKHCPASSGIWAPTIRYHNERFYVITTNFSKRRNFFVWTDDIRGEWSEPIWIDQGGIDPSLLFDDDGAVYCTSTFDEPTGQTIGQCQLDIRTGEMLTPMRRIWAGSGGKYPEGPHLYRRGKWYYLIAAEGGTEYGHMVTIARSLSPWGPFTGCSRNPILTHRDTPLSEFQAIGHAELVDTPSGESWIVFHGIRTTQYMLHHLGRETMLAPVTWDEDGWPVVNDGQLIQPKMDVPRLPDKEFLHCVDFHERFDSPRLAPCWTMLRNPDPSQYQLNNEKRHIRIIPNAYTLDDLASPGFIGVRQTEFDVRAQVTLSFDPRDTCDFAGLAVYHTNEHHYDLGVQLVNEQRCCVLRKRVGDMQVEMGYVPLEVGVPVHLRIEADKTLYCFYAGTSDGDMKLIGTGRTQLLSTECMVMTFTGCFIGLFAQGNESAFFSDFSVECY